MSAVVKFSILKGDGENSKIITTAITYYSTVTKY